MLSVRLCCPAGAEIMFLLLSAKSVAGLHNIIGDARRARPVGDLAYPEREGRRRELADIGRQQLETPALAGINAARIAVVRPLPHCRVSSDHRGDGARAAAQGGRLCCPPHRVGPENAGHEAVSQHNLTHNIIPLMWCTT